MCWQSRYVFFRERQPGWCDSHDLFLLGTHGAGRSTRPCARRLARFLVLENLRSFRRAVAERLAELPQGAAAG